MAIRVHSGFEITRPPDLRLTVYFFWLPLFSNSTEAGTPTTVRNNAVLKQAEVVIDIMEIILLDI